MKAYFSQLWRRPLWWWLMVALTASIGGSALADLIVGPHATGFVATLSRATFRTPGTLIFWVGLAQWARRKEY